MRISAFVEKPLRGKAPSSYAAIGRYVITPDMMHILKKQKAGKDGEIRLADAFQTALKKDIPLYGHALEGTRHDCGNKLGYVIAQIEMGLLHPDIGADLKKYLKNSSCA
jgi:UTP--glucose-1-phosphate uridylyltransferase